MKQQRSAKAKWNPSDLPESKIWPALGSFSKLAIARVLEISKEYAYQVVSGQRVPHRRHWAKLAELVGIVSG